MSPFSSFFINPFIYVFRLKKGWCLTNLLILAGVLTFVAETKNACHSFIDYIAALLFGSLEHGRSLNQQWLAFVELLADKAVLPLYSRFEVQMFRSLLELILIRQAFALLEMLLSRAQPPKNFDYTVRMGFCNKNITSIFF
jgi:hypothetical protein